MDAITLWQPYASLIAVKAKTIETRAWAPPLSVCGERIAIHAAKRPCDPAELAAISVKLAAAVQHVLGERFLHELPYGAVVATARLVFVDRVVAHSLDGRRWRGQHRTGPIDVFGDFTPGRWLWGLAEIEALDPPIPARGHQTLWDWPAPGEERAAPRVEQPRLAI